MPIAIAAHGWQRLRPEARFPFRFAALLAALWYLALGGISDLADAMVGVTVGTLEWVCNAVTLDTFRGSGGVMYFGGGTFGYEIVPACTIAVPGVLYTAAVLAYPASWRHRAFGLVGGLIGLFAFNTLRLVGLAWVGVEAPNAFDTLHWYAFQILLIFVTGLIFIAWARWVVQGHARREVGRWADAGRSVGVFAAVFGALTVLGMNEVIVSAYSRVVSGLFLLVGSRFWPDIELMHFFSWGYALMFWATFAAFLALVLATRSRSPRERLRKAFIEVVPLLVVLQTLDLLLVAGLDISAARGGFWTSQSHEAQQAIWVAGHVLFLAAIPFADWWIWTKLDTSERRLPGCGNGAPGRPRAAVGSPIEKGRIE